MTAAERLGRAAELLEQAVAELEAAEPDTPAYCIEPMRFLKCEVKVSIKRARNAAKVLSRCRT